MSQSVYPSLDFERLVVRWFYLIYVCPVYPPKGLPPSDRLEAEFGVGDLAASPDTFGSPSLASRCSARFLPPASGDGFSSLPIPCRSLIVSTRGHRGSPGKNNMVLRNLMNHLSRAESYEWQLLKCD